MKTKVQKNKKGGYMVTLGLVAASAVYVFSQYTPAAQALASSGTTSTASAAAATAPSGLYNDGTYTGTAYDALYGSVQVQATVSGGQLTDVQFLKYPGDRRTSQNINNRAMSQLKREAIAVQGSRVNTVSGATDTSEAFRQSLHSALIQAQA